MVASPGHLELMLGGKKLKKVWSYPISREISIEHEWGSLRLPNQLPTKRFRALLILFPLFCTRVIASHI